jgi:hypothetical protein
MSLTSEELKELESLEKELGGNAGYVSVLDPNRKDPSLLQQFGTSVVQNLPELGGMFGGVVGALGTRSPAGARAGQALGAAAVRSMVGAGFGGAAGEASRQAITGQPSVFGTVKAGVEQATYDAAGNLIFSAAGKAYRLGKEALSSKFGNQIPDNAIFAADRLLKEEGAFGLTPFQSTGSGLSGVSESIARGSFTARPIMAAADKATDTALQSAKTKILDNISTNVYDSVATGKSFAESIAAGDDALKETVSPFYKSMSEAAKNISVDIVPLQSQAAQILNRADKAGGLNISAGEKTFLNQIVEAPEKVDFTIAHDILSGLKTRQRDLKSTTTPDTKLYAQITSFTKNLEKQMDAAGSKVSGSAIDFQGRLPEDKSKTLTEQYKFYSKLYRDSVTDLYSDTTAKLLNKDPEYVGKNIFQSGNVTAFQETKQALGRAKQLNPDLNVNDTLNSVRRGYVENLLKSEGSLSTLGSKIDTDEAVRRTFETVLSKEQQANVKKLLKAAELSSVRPEATAPLFLAAQQAQSVTGLAGLGALVLSDDAKKVASENPGWTALTAGAVLLGPRFIAKSITNPEAVNAAIALYKQQEKGLPITANLFAKSLKVFERAGITAQDLLQPETDTSSPAPVGLTAAEQEELRLLESELQGQQ